MVFIHFVSLSVRIIFYFTTERAKYNIGDKDK